MSEDKKAPPVIWLQDEDDENHPECGEWYEGATWCEEAINDGDVKYIRADIAERYRTALVELKEMARLLPSEIMEGIIDEALHPTQPAEGREK